MTAAAHTFLVLALLCCAGAAGAFLEGTLQSRAEATGVSDRGERQEGEKRTKDETQRRLEFDRGGSATLTLRAGTCGRLSRYEPESPRFTIL